MPDHILFLNSKSDFNITKKIYDTESVARIRMHERSDFLNQVRVHFSKIWLDPSYDCLPEGQENEKWFSMFKKHLHFEEILESGFSSQENSDDHLFSIMNGCLDMKPDFISIPQLPYLKEVKNNKVNKQLAISFQKWKKSKSYRGKSILPVVFINQNALNSGAERTKSFKNIKKFYEFAEADGIWLADSSLQDQLGTRKFETVRFPALINIHQRIQDEINPSFHIAGPYWGLNILLWARGIISNPAFAIGAGYQHFRIRGGHINPPTQRLAIEPLRRWVRASTDIKNWLARSGKKLDKLPEGKIFKGLHKNYERITLNPDSAKNKSLKNISIGFKDLRVFLKKGEALLYTKICPTLTF